MTRKIPDSLVRDAASLITGGMTLKNASASIGFGPDAVSTRLKQVGFTVPIGGKPAFNRIDLPEQEVIRLYESGMGTPAIATKFGLKSRMAVIRVLLTNGIPQRAKGANLIERMRLMSPTDRVKNIQKARNVRLSKLAEASTLDTPAHPHVGTGYPILRSMLVAMGFSPQVQIPCGPYYLDLTVNTVAIEAIYRHHHSIRSRNGKRLECLLKSGYLPFLVYFSSPEALTNCTAHLVSHFKIACRTKPNGGEYWVLRCDDNRGFTYTKDDYWSAIQRPKYSRQTLNWLK